MKSRSLSYCLFLEEIVLSLVRSAEDTERRFDLIEYRDGKGNLAVITMEDVRKIVRQTREGDGT